MTISQKIEQIREYALTAKACIYNEDAMTAIELAGQTACKVNECADAINSILDILEEMGVAGIEYDSDAEAIAI